MPEQPFHHGRLRSEMLERAERIIREQGPEAVSLRELARQSGVSHAAPRRHFPDRQALLDAVAERGFTRLTSALLAAAASASPDPAARFRAAATAYVEFSADEARVHDLMFARKTESAPASLDAAAEEFFVVSNRLLTPEAAPDTSAPLTTDARRMLIIVALQGTAALVAARRIDRATADAVLDELVATFYG